MKKIAVVLSGCGFLDGAEITESISTLIAITQAGAEFQIFAPNHNYHPTNHFTSNIENSETRNTLVEAARIGRGNAKDLAQLNEADFDALVFPGGYGAATHLSSWGQQGSKCKVDSTVEKLIKSFHRASKPIGAMCIAPTLIAKVLGSENVSLTIGNSKEVASEISKTGAQHVECPVEDYITDRLHKVITTPAYMYDTEPHKVFQGINGMIRELVEMA